MIKAELWDKMQHIMAKYNDHMMHTHIQFSGSFDLELLKKALSIAIDKVPILKHYFNIGFVKPQWLPIENFSIDDVFSYVTTDGDGLKISEEFLVQVIDETKEAQIKILLLRTKETYYINFLVNHMCFDGTDFKNFLTLFKDIYNDLVKGGKGDIPFKSGSRDEFQLFDDFTPEDKKVATNLLKYNSDAKHPISFPYETTDRSKLTPRILKLKVPASIFNLAKIRAKERGVSINDIVVAAFIRAAYSIIDIPKDTSLGVPNMVDLRRYRKDGVSLGMTNMVSMMICNIGLDIGKDIFDTVTKVHSDLESKKDNFPGLHGLPNLRRAFSILPYCLSHFLIGIFYKNPLIGISNIGIVHEDALKIDGIDVTDVYMTGSIKYPPYMQLSLATFKGEITHTIASYMTDKDAENFNKLLTAYNQELLTFAKG